MLEELHDYFLYQKLLGEQGRHRAENRYREYSKVDNYGS